MARISVIGESLVDVVNRTPYPGGSPLNVAVGLSRLGHEVIFHTEFGLDEHGALIAEHLRAAGVALSDGAQRLVATNQAQVKIDDAGRASYRFNITWDLPDEVIAPGTDLLHAGSIGAWLEPGAAKVLAAFTTSPKTQIRSFDPNIRPELATHRERVLAQVEALMGLSHVVKLSESDAAWLYPELAAPAVLEHVQALGPRLVVLTRGALGSLARSGTRDYVQPALATDVIDTVGAGAGFMSGLLHGILESSLAASLVDGTAELDPAAVTRSLRTAAASAALTVAQSGAQLPGPDALSDVLERGN